MLLLSQVLGRRSVTNLPRVHPEEANSAGHVLLCIFRRVTVCIHEEEEEDTCKMV